MISQKVIQLIRVQGALGNDYEIRTNHHLVEDLGYDSLDQVELVMEVEEVFEIELHDDDLENIQTVQQAIDLVNRALGN